MRTAYLQPSTVAETLELLAQHGDRSRLINGGTDLMIEIERKLRAPQLLIDISRVAGLAEIHIAGDTVRIHAGVTHNQVVAHPLLRERAFALVRACWEVGAPQIRNRGTLAGNLVTASPANDTITPLWALGATVTLRSLRGARTLAFPDFFQGVRKTALAPDEMLTEIAFDLPSPGARSTFLKLGLRRAQAISVVDVAVIIDEGTDGAPVSTPEGLRNIRRANITLGSVAPTIVAAHKAEEWLLGKSLTDEMIAEAGRLAAQAAAPIDDVRGTAAYRRDMVRVYVMRALRQLRAGSERDGFPVQPVMLWGRTPGVRQDTKNAASSPVSIPGLAAAASPPPIETSVNGRHFSVNQRPRADAAAFPARRPSPDRHQGRAARKGNAGLHGVPGRGGGDVLPGAGLAGARCGDRDHRGHQSKRRTASGPACVCRGGRRPVWLLHAGLCDERRQAAGGGCFSLALRHPTGLSPAICVAAPDTRRSFRL